MNLSQSIDRHHRAIDPPAGVCCNHRITDGEIDGNRAYRQQGKRAARRGLRYTLPRFEAAAARLRRRRLSVHERRIPECNRATQSKEKHMELLIAIELALMLAVALKVSVGNIERELIREPARYNDIA